MRGRRAPLRTTVKELIHEEFGDGMMSPDPKGDRVHVELSGKLLSYKTY